jgi:hypothetical protein
VGVSLIARGKIFRRFLLARILVTVVGSDLVMKFY